MKSSTVFEKLALILVCAVVFIGIAVPGEGAAQSKEGQESQQYEIVKSYKKGVLALDLLVTTLEITAAEDIKLVLRAETKENYAFSFPEPDVLGEFQVVSKNKSKPELTAAGLLASRAEYILEPPGPGEFEIPRVVVSSWLKGEEQAELFEIQTDAVKIIVNSLFAGGNTEALLSDIAPPVSQPYNKFLIAGIVIAILAALFLTFFLWKKRAQKQKIPPPPIPAHVRAYKALDRLMAGDFFAKGQVKEFYAEVSDVLRQYIEQRFGLRAPERTTEEFFNELGDVSVKLNNTAGNMFYFSVSHKELLRDFLTHCDLVKFARHLPEIDDAQRAVGLCRKFIKESASSPLSGSNNKVEVMSESET